GPPGRCRGRSDRPSEGGFRSPGPAAAGPEQDVPAPEQLPPLPPDTAAPQAWGPQRPASAPQPPPGQWGRGQRGPGEPPGPEAAPSGPQSRDAPPPAPGPAHPPGPWQQGGRPRPGPDYDGSYDPYRQPGAGPAGAPAPHPGAPPGPHQPGQPYQPAPGPQSGPQPGFQYSAHFAEGVQPAQQYPGQGGHPETAEDLRAENLVGDKSRGPGKGWRKALHSATFGLINVGESAAEQRRRDLTERARTHVGGGHHRVAVLSLKGGVGKTTTTVALGSMLASLRGDRVLAVDANPDRGTLSDKVRLETAATIRDLLNERGAVSRYADIRGFTSQADSRLEILASDRDPAVSEAFSEEDYREVCRLLEHYYSICLTDCGTGLLHSAMSGVLGLSDQIVLVSSASVDGARSASATLDWLEAHQYGSLVRGAVVVLSMVRTGKSSVDLERLEQHFASRCRAVMRVPWDSHLEEGAEVDLERLAPGTRDAYLQLAATVGEAFAWPR
ncbi:nucleotide-binding protein, partial [Streptomonospora salina]|uniref:nucleotide-binding protein n=1 Tax=Streptomonospora salina TaxID=104205 RepID=UPI0035EBFDB3